MEYKIEIVNKALDGASDKVFAGGGGSSASSKNSESGNKTEESAKKLLSASQIVPFVKQAIGFSVNTISLRTGAEESQQRAQFAYDIASQAFSLGKGIWIGAIAGGLPGALVGAGLSILTTVFSYSYKAQEIQMQSDLEQISLAGLNRRAGSYAPSHTGSREVRQ